MRHTPGVTVEASSPALIEKVQTVTADGTGLYRLVNLPPDTLTFTLQGFNTVRRESVDVVAGVTVTIDTEMRLGWLQKTLTVTGESPIVDLRSAAQTRTVTAQAFKELRVGSSWIQMAALVPTIRATNVDVGGVLGLQARGLRGASTTLKKLYDIKGAIGGPIRRDRLWFFVTSRYFTNQYYLASRFYPRDVTAIRRENDPSRQAYGGTYSYDNNGRLTWAINDKQKISGWYAYQLRHRIAQHEDRVRAGRVDLNVDFYNAFNSDTVITELGTFGPAWRLPPTVIQPRFVKCAFVKFAVRWDCWPPRALGPGPLALGLNEVRGGARWADGAVPRSSRPSDPLVYSAPPIRRRATARRPTGGIRCLGCCSFQSQ